MDQRIGDQLADRIVRKELHLLSQGMLDHFVLGKLPHDEIDQALEPNRVAAPANLIDLRLKLRGPGVDNHARSLPRQVWELVQSLGEQQPAESSDRITTRLAIDQPFRYEPIEHALPSGWITGHARGSTRAKASEMEHAIRKHCTIHFDEDPAFFKRMSEKLDTLIAKHGDDWMALAERYEELRAEIRAGRGDPQTDRPAEVFVLRDNLFDLIDDGATLSAEDAALLDALSARLVSIVREAITIVDFWRKPDQVRRLRASIDTELMVSGRGSPTSVDLID